MIGYKWCLEWKQIKDGAQGLLYLEWNSKAFAIPTLTAI